MRKPYEDEQEDRETFSPWESYSDLYCGLLLVFILLFFFVIYQYIDARETNDVETKALQEELRGEQAALSLYKSDLENQEEELVQKETELAQRDTILEQKESELTQKNEELAQKESELTQKNGELAQKDTELAQKESELADQAVLLADQAEINENQEALLAQKESELTEQKAIVESQKKQLKDQEKQLQQIIGVRAQLIEALNKALSEKGIKARADQKTGAIAFSSSILFELNSDELSKDGQEFFREFMPVYCSVLLSDEFKPYVAEMIIEGHTDSRGTYFHNLELSQQRALSVAEFCLDKENDVLSDEETEQVRTLLTINGCADKDPVYKENGEMDEDESRRVQIKFRLRDEDMIQEMDELLSREDNVE